MPQQSLLPLRSGPGVAVIAATVLASMTGFLEASVVNVAVPVPLRRTRPYHGCALPHTGTGDRVRTSTARTSEPS